MSDETRDAVIIDCGAFYEDERHAVVKYIRDNGLKPCHLLETHAHIDHNFGNDTILNEFGLKPELHVKDAYLHETLKEQALAFANISIDYDMPQAGKLLSENNTIVFGTHQFRILSTPGHTPGSVFYYCEDEKVAFSGDTLFRMSIGRTDFELGSYRDMTESLGRITKLLPADTVILPGHGPQTTMREETNDNPYLNQY